MSVLPPPTLVTSRVYAMPGLLLPLVLKGLLADNPLRKSFVSPPRKTARLDADATDLAALLSEIRLDVRQFEAAEVAAATTAAKGQASPPPLTR